MFYKAPSLQNFEWQQAVDDIVSAPTGSEVKGYRYIISVGTGDFSGYNNYIVTAKISNPSSSSDWTFDAPSKGMIVFVKDENILYIYISSWDVYSLGNFAPNDAKYIVGNTSNVTGLTNEILTPSIGVENLLLNGDFEYWLNGTSVAPNHWSLQGSGATIARESSIVKLSRYSAKVTRNGTDTDLYNSNYITSPILKKGITYFQNRTITLGCWVYATVANRARIAILANSAVYSDYHSGNSTWEWLTVSKTVDSSASVMLIFLQVNNGDTSAYFDGVTLVEGLASFAFCSNIQDIVGVEISSAPSVVGNNFDKAWYSSGGTRRLYVCDGSDWKYVAVST